jgi:hypothetical protein
MMQIIFTGTLERGAAIPIAFVNTEYIVKTVIKRRIEKRIA